MTSRRFFLNRVRAMVEDWPNRATMDELTYYGHFYTRLAARLPHD
jgi:hypothetical protein